jgi:hypothetical protein
MKCRLPNTVGYQRSTEQLRQQFKSPYKGDSDAFTASNSGLDPARSASSDGLGRERRAAIFPHQCVENRHEIVKSPFKHV